MKKLFIFMLLFTMAVSSVFAYANEKSVSISVNGATVDFGDALPYADENGAVHVPVRILGEALGKSVKWIGETQSIVVGEDLTFEIGKTAFLKDSKAYIQIEDLIESLNFKAETDEKNENINIIGESKKAFDFSLLKKMPKDKNYIFSPYSLKMAMAMAANGAEGETQSEILNTLGISDLSSFNKEAKEFISSSNKNEDVKFNIANSIWHNKDYAGDNIDFSATYKGLISEFYNGNAEKIGNADGAEIINSWISKETMNKINDIIDDTTVENSLSFLVNTIYFKGDWALPFTAEATKEAVFTDRNGKDTEILFMNSTGFYDYFEGSDFKVLAKPYKDRDIKMYFVLSNKGDMITEDIFEKAVNNMESKYVKFSLPKFKTEYLHGDLAEILKSMGVKTAFDPYNADFSKMYSGNLAENPYIGGIIQKAFIEIDEKGTEAAAATVITMQTNSAIISEITAFDCNVPFTYFLRNDATGEILFMGEYAFAQ